MADRSETVEQLAQALYQYKDGTVNTVLVSSTITDKEQQAVLNRITALREEQQLLIKLPEDYIKSATAAVTSDRQVQESITESILQLKIEKGTTQEVIAAKYEEILVGNGIEASKAKETASRMANAASMREELKLSNLLKGAWTNLTSFVKANPIAVGIGVAAAGIYTAYQIGVRNFENMQKAADEAAESWSNLSSALSENRQAVADISEEYSQLAQGIGSNGENIGLTADEFDRYNTITKQISEMFPEMVAGYTTQGDAILRYKGNVEALNEALERQQEVYYGTVLRDAGDIFKEWNATSWTNQSDTLRYQMGVQSYLEDVLRQSDMPGVDSEDIAAILKASFDHSREIRDSVGEDPQDILDEALGGQLRSIYPTLLNGTEEEQAAAVRNFLVLIRTAVAEGRAAVDAETQNMESIAEAYLGTSFDFSLLSSDTQEAARQFVSQLDYTFYREFESQDQMYLWLEQNLIAPLRSESNAAKFKKALEFFLEKGLEINGTEFTDNFAAFSDAIDALRSGLEQGFDADFDWTAFYHGYDSVKLLIDILVELGILEAPTSDAIYSITRKIEEMSSAAQAAASDVLSLSESLKSISGKYDIVKSAQEEFAELGRFTLDTLTSILETYGGMEESVSLYIAGLKTEQELLADLDRLYQADLKDYQDTVLQKLYVSETFFKEIDANTRTQLEDLAEAYDVDLDNFRTIEEMKLAIQAEIVKKLAQNYAKYANATYEDLKSQYNALSGLQNDLKSNQTVFDTKDSGNALLSNPLLRDANSLLEQRLAESFNQHALQAVSGELQALENALNEMEKANSKINEIVGGEGLVKALDPSRFAEATKSAAEDAEDDIEDIYEEIRDWFEDMEFKVQLRVEAGDIDGALSMYREMVARANEELQKAYASGLTIDDDWVQELIDKVGEYGKALSDLVLDEYDKLIEYNDDFDVWNKVSYSKLDVLANKLKRINELYLEGSLAYQDWYELYMDTASEIYDLRKDALEELLDQVMDAIKEENDAQIDALEEQRDAYQDLIDLKKKLLEDAADEAKYEREVAKRVKEIAKLQERITQLQLDDSREAAAERAKLEEELAEKQQDLADYQADYALDATLDALDEQSDAYSSAMDEEIAAVKKQIERETDLRQAAIDKINSDYREMTEDVRGYFEALGITLDEEIIQRLTEGLKLVSQYGSYEGAVDNIGSDIVGDTADNIQNQQQIPALVQQMRSNSNAWWTAKNAGDKTEMQRLSTENERIAQILKSAFGLDVWKDSAQGTWYINTANGKMRLFDVYHDGGVVGGLQTKNNNELMAILEKGEVVFNDGQQVALLDRFKQMSETVSQMVQATVRGMSAAMAPLGALSQAGGPSYAPNIVVNIEHNGEMTDDDAKRYGETIGTRALDVLWKAMNQRGIT